MMDILLILGISWAEAVLDGKIFLVNEEQKRFILSFFNTQSDELAVNKVGATPYGLTDEQRVDLLTSFLVASLRVEGGEV